MARQITANPLDVISASSHGLQVITTPASPSATHQGNQGTALVARNLTSFPSLYASAPSGKPSSCNTAYFRCAPRELLPGKGKRARLEIKVFERHPYTRQAFFPMGRDSNRRAYVVVVTKDKGISSHNVTNSRRKTRSGKHTCFCRQGKSGHRV